MPGNQFGVAEKGKYLESSKSGAHSMKSGGMKYSGQSGTVTKKGDTGPMPTPAANVQHNYHGGKKY